jgi:His-Xaa-Ser system radical SAM maturase HxsB
VTVLPAAAALDTQSQAFFRFRPLPGTDKVVLTSLEGNYAVLSGDEFRRFASGQVDARSPLHEQLTKGNFLKAGFDAQKAAEKLRARKRWLDHGPNLHIFVVTLRCNETCVYCHASRANMDAVHTDMSREVAERSVDLVLQSTNPQVTIEFQGGEPLVNFDIVKHVIEYALEKNKQAGKDLEFTMVSNLSLMDEAKLEYLLKHKVQICTSVDGPAALHDAQRKLPKASAFGQAKEWIARINSAYAAMGLDPTLYHVEALLTTTRDTLPKWKEVVDTYVDLGCRALFLRPVDPFGWMDKTGNRVDYPRAEYMAFYRQAVDYMVELNQKGVQILERYASIFLTKILADDPNFLDIRSPAGAGIGQLAYNYDGKVFTCDEGRMLHEGGDSSFLIGDVFKSSYRVLVGHETVRAMVIASNLDGQPDCVNCSYNPYCGTQTTHLHKSFGSIFGRMRESTLCAVHKGIQDYLFERLSGGDPKVLEVFTKWTTQRPRDHFIQARAPGA